MLSDLKVLYEQYADRTEPENRLPRNLFLKRTAAVRRQVDRARPGLYQYWNKARRASFGYAYIQDLYDGEIKFTDDQLARIVEALDTLKLKENTLIILTSDHGDEFVEHGNMGHGISCYDEIIRVPLIFYGPGRLPAGLRVKENTALIDLVPTILDLAGIEPRPHFEGLSLQPLMRGTPLPPRRLFSEHLYSRKVPDYAPVVMMDGKWKYHYDKEKNRPDELYDLEEDPGETKNLAPDRPDVVRRLRETVENHLSSASAPELETIGPDRALEKQLRDLGYIE